MNTYFGKIDKEKSKENSLRETIINVQNWNFIMCFWI